MKFPGRLWGRSNGAASAPPDYAFSSDWFTGNIYLFERNLRHLAGTPCRILEIGSFEGRSTLWALGNLATHEAATIDCIDLALRPALRRNIALAPSAQKITLHEGRSRDLLGGLPRAAFDFIYIDGSHEKVDVLEDAVLAFRLAKVGAVIAFDDYTEDGPDWNPQDFAKPAIDAFLDVYGNRIEVLERCHQIWVRKQREEPPG